MTPIRAAGLLCTVLGAPTYHALAVEVNAWLKVRPRAVLHHVAYADMVLSDDAHAASVLLLWTEGPGGDP